jgi:GNAT superfamily N-acetyltransferase
MYDIVFDKRRLDVGAIHEALRKSHWAAGVSRATVQRAIAHSLCVGVLHADRQVAFARAVTDEATFAWLADVYVDPAHRGRGVARQMVQALLGRRELQGLRSLLLRSRDAQGLYAKLGFAPLGEPQRFMELRRCD